MRQHPLAIVTIHDACPAFSKKIFTFTDKLERLRIHYNIALVPFFNEKQDLPRFPNFINQIKNCKGEIALHGLYHEKRNGQIDDFHTRSIAIAEIEIRAGLEILQEVGINNVAVFVPPQWRLNPYSMRVLKKAPSFVLARSEPATYLRQYVSALHSLRPCWMTFLRTLYI